MAPGRWPPAYCSRPSGSATAAPWGRLRVSTMRTRGSSRCWASQATSTNGALTLNGDRAGAEVEALFRIVGDVFADRQRRRCGRRGRIAHVHDPLAAFEHEVVDHRTVGRHGLCPYAGGTRERVLRRQRGDVAL